MSDWCIDVAYNEHSKTILSLDCGPFVWLDPIRSESSGQAPDVNGRTLRFSETSIVSQTNRRWPIVACRDSCMSGGPNAVRNEQGELTSNDHLQLAKRFVVKLWCATTNLGRYLREVGTEERQSD